MAGNGNNKEFQARMKALELDKEGVKRQHKKGKLTALERINLLLDDNSFMELDAFAELDNEDLKSKKRPRDGVITGYGTINKRPIYIYAQDFTFMGGSMGEMHNKKIEKTFNQALKTGCPIIGLLDSGGARIQEGISSLDSGGNIFRLNTMASGVIPQISAILGPCAGIAVYSPSLTDFIFMTKNISNMFITGPDVIKTVTGEDINFEDLGGAKVHNEKSGVAHFMADNEKQCLQMIKLLLSYLPQNNLENAPYANMNDSAERMNSSLKNIVPQSSKKTYDIRNVIKEVLDKRSFFEIQEYYAQNAVIGLGRLNNNSVGIVATQPCVLAGCLDINSSGKISRFVRFCDCFNIPLINFVDVTGYLPGSTQEHNGIIKHGAKILYAYSEATVPKISLVIRKAYGGAYIALVSKDMGYDKVIAWPNAEIAVMGAEQAVSIVNKKELTGKNKEKIRKERVEEYKKKFLNPYVAAQQGRIDSIIEPKETRKTLIKCLEMLLNKRDKRPAKKHGNIPL
jgi:acetyl-CoA carboxylase carboxyltransferase component|tara:strand:+ start:409 stop:1944 length:1536 start_codon:yes stop_codon:yes gene_type:complete